MASVHRSAAVVLAALAVVSCSSDDAAESGTTTTTQASPSTTADQPQDDPPASSPADVDPAIVAALEDGRPIHVIVSLVQPDGDATADATAREEISASQDRVLSALGTDGFELRVRFETVPAFAGRLTTRDALATLESHPDVVAVGLDVGGTGY